MSRADDPSNQNESGSERFLKIVRIALSVTWAVIKWLFFVFIFGFGLVIFLVRMIDAIANGRPAPEFKPPGRRKPREFDEEKFRQDIQEATVEDIFKEFGEQIEEADKRNQLNTDQKKVVRKLRGLDRSKLRSQLKNALSDEETEILFLLLLQLIGIKLR